MELAVWHSATCRSARFDEASETWEVTVERAGTTHTLHPTQAGDRDRHVGHPQHPALRRCRQLHRRAKHHSSKHPGGDAWRGKRAVVVGSNNSAHDIAADLFEHGAAVTMVQSSSTHIARSESLMTFATGVLYSEQAVASGITTEKADLLFASIPYRIMGDVPEAGRRPDPRSRRPPSTSASSAPASCSISATTDPDCS